ncbi:MAG: GC-type dockerin domain-anchored protein [Phycisphaerales bacterium JB040]
MLVALCVLAVPAAGQAVREDFKLLPGDGSPEDQFGWSIALGDGKVVVGAWLDDDNGAGSGSAYLFDAASGLQLAKLLPVDGAPGDQFGWSVAIGGGVVAVGAHLDDDNGPESGGVYLFDAASGAELRKLLPDDGAPDDQFGWSVSIDAGLVAVGSWRDDDGGSNSGSAYLFDAATGAQLVKLLPEDGAVNDLFGAPIAIRDGVVAVGSFSDDDNGPNSGSVYLFDAGTGAQLRKLLPDDGAEGDRFGRSIGLGGGIAAVTSFLDDDNGLDSGSAYLFDLGTGVQLAKLLPGDGAERDRFGYSIGLDAGVVVVGAAYDADNGGASGSAYLFDAATGVQLAKLLPRDGASGDRFGRTVALDAGVAGAGAYGGDDNGTNSGAAYLFDLRCLGVPRSDLNADGVLDNADINAFVAAYLAGDAGADVNRDGVFDNGDIGDFVSAFLAGC